jgi:uncharacterized protein HemX
VKRLIQILLVILLIATGGDSFAQRQKRQSTKKQMKEQAQNENSAKAEIAGRYSKNKDHHTNIQGKSTQKRMRKNRREVHRRNSGRHIPFYQRWFRKRHFK